MPPRDANRYKHARNRVCQVRASTKIQTIKADIKDIIIMKTSLKTIVAASILAAVSQQAEAGFLFVTGHDTDDHANGDYQRAGLDFLSFGTIASGAQIAQRATISVGYLGNGDGSTFGEATSGYTDRTFIDLDVAGWENIAFGITAGVNNFDILIIGSGLDFVSAAGSTALNAQAAGFASYFNNDGGLYVNTDQGLGQPFYNFLPTFGASNNSISAVGTFTATPAGLAIGLTEAIVDADITHSFYNGVDTSIFTIFETYDSEPGNPPVAIGLRNAVIGGGGFGTSVPEPGSALAGVAACLVGLVRRRRAH